MDNNMTVSELIDTITEFYEEEKEKHRTIIKPLQVDQETLGTLMYLLCQHSLTGTPVTTQILRLIGEYRTVEDTEFEEILGEELKEDDVR